MVEVVVVMVMLLGFALGFGGLVVWLLKLTGGRR